MTVIVKAVNNDDIDTVVRHDTTMRILRFESCVQEIVIETGRKMRGSLVTDVCCLGGKVEGKTGR